MGTIHELIESYLKKEDQTIFGKILEQLKTESGLWTILVRTTNNFYMGIENEKPAAYLFTDKQFADEFMKEIKWEGIQVKSLEISPEKRIAFFNDLYRSGFEAVAIDKGQDSLIASLFSIVDKPEAEQQEELIMNPSLMRAAIQFYQGLASRHAVKEMQDLMCNEIYKAAFILPVKISSLEEGETEKYLFERKEGQDYPILRNPQGKKFYPIFTDWIEFGKYDRNKQHKGVLVHFKDLKKLIRKVDGIVVNPLGFNLILDQEKMEKILKESAGLRVL